MIKTIITPVLLMLLTAFPAARATGEEVLILHTDRRMYVAGEIMWFSIYVSNFQNGLSTAGSSVVSVELVNPWNMPVAQSRFALSDGRGKGDLIIPDTLSSGTYLLKAYGGQIGNTPAERCFIQKIGIYNPLAGEEYFRITRNKSGSGLSSGFDFSEIEIMTDSVKERRESINVRLNTNSGPAGLSISIVPAGISAGSPEAGLMAEPGYSSGSFKSGNSGHYLSGSLRYRNPVTTDSSRFLYASVRGKTAEFYHARIGVNGRFDLRLPIDSRERVLIIQPGNAGSNVALEIDPSFTSFHERMALTRDTLDEFQRSVFSRLSFNFQAARIYGIPLFENQPEKTERAARTRRFYGIPEMEVHLDDYIRLPVMQEVFFELLPGIILRNKDSGYEIKITNPLTGKYYDEPPLVMIDGVIINDLNILAGLDPAKVERIEVVMTPYLTGDLILHGIVNVITLEGDFGEMTMQDYAAILPYRSVEEPKVFIHPDYSDSTFGSDHIPDLRNTLYWEPSLKTDNRGRAEVVFRTSDQPGLYEITVFGLTESGKWVYGSRTFRVD